jgi:hypothetical protein
MERRHYLTSLPCVGLFSFATIADTPIQQDRSVENGAMPAPNTREPKTKSVSERTYGN